MGQNVKNLKLKAAQQVESMYGRGAYRMMWENKSWVSRTYGTLRGHNPGGRGGAPTFEEVEASYGDVEKPPVMDQILNDVFSELDREGFVR